jgi:hypothetical protein
MQAGGSLKADQSTDYRYDPKIMISAPLAQERRRFGQRWIPAWGVAAISPHVAPVLVGLPLQGPGSLPNQLRFDKRSASAPARSSL